MESVGRGVYDEEAGRMSRVVDMEMIPRPTRKKKILFFCFLVFAREKWVGGINT